MIKASAISVHVVGAMCFGFPGGAESAEQWGGYYGGVSLGFGAGDLSGVQDCCPFDPGDDPDNLDPSGLVAGLHFGRDFQRDRMVFGVVADASLANFEDRQFSLTEVIPNQSDIDINGLASLRGKIGYSGGDRLYYATVGLGYVSGEYTMRDPDGAVSIGTVDVSGAGPVFGFGIEWFVKGNSAVFAEVLHYNAGERVATDNLTTDSDAGDFVELNGVSLLRFGAHLRF